MARAATVAVDLQANNASFISGLKRADAALAKSGARWNRALRTTDQNFARVGKAMSAINYTAAAVGIGSVGSAFTAAAVKAAQFGEAMAEVSTLLDDKSAITGLRSEVLRLSAAFGSDAVTQAKALYQVISAGATDSAQAIDILTTANKLAKGGVTDVTTAADGLTSTLNAYGDQVKSATDASDAFFVAVKAGKTTVNELSSYIGQVAPIAAQAGVSLDELLAATAALTKGGIKTSIAMNGLRQVIANVIKPSSEASKMAAELGIQFDATALKSKGLAGFLLDVTAKTKGNTEQLAKLFGSVEALGPVLALTGTQANDFGNILVSMASKAGETQKALATITDTPIENFRKMKAEGEAAMIGIGDVILKELNPAMEGLVARMRMFNAMFSTVQKPENQLLILDKRIRDLRKSLDDLRSDGIPDWIQFSQIDLVESRLRTVTDQYNELADTIHRTNAQAAAAAAKVEKPVGGSGVQQVNPSGGSTAKISEELEKLRQKTSDAEFELSLLTQGYSDAEQEALRFARSQGFLNQALGDKAISKEELDAIDEYVASLEKLNKAQKDAEKSAKDLKAEEKSMLQQYAEDSTNTMKQIDRFTTNSFKSMEDALTEFVTTGKLNFKSLARSIINDLVRMQIQASVTGPLSGMLSSAFGSLFSVSGPAAATSKTGGYIIAAPGGSFAGGGYTGSAPRSGGIDGQGGFMAMLHPQETVIDHAKSGSMSRTMSQNGGTYYIDARGADKQGMSELKNMLKSLNGTIEARAVSAVANAQRRGGGMRKMLG